MLLVLATSALGSLKMCNTLLPIEIAITNPDAPPPPVTCDEPTTQCNDLEGSDVKIGECKNVELNGVAPDGVMASGKWTCSGNKVASERHATEDCSDDVSAECADLMQATRGGCSITYTIGECEDHRATSLVDTKLTGSCPGEDEPCFSREAEACRIVDTSVAPFAAFRACFDEAAPTVAERVKMTALTGGDYILSAGKDQAYEFTRVIVNQHKLTEARRPATPAHHSPIGLAFALAPSPPPPSVSPPPHCTRAEALEHAQDRPRRR